MANQEHLNVLKQGEEVWNQWRQKNPSIRPDLSRVTLREANLKGIDLTDVNFNQADLSRANLRETIFKRTSLSGINLSGANLSASSFVHVIFNRANLKEANLSQSMLIAVAFGDVDLSMVKGLETVKHLTPSIIDINTMD